MLLRSRSLLHLFLPGLVALLWCSLETRISAAPAPDFNRDINPIFSDHCYACHGPDDAKRKAGLRLDQKEGAFKELKSGNRAVVAGDLKKSAMIERIISQDPDEVMPPHKGGKPLSEQQIDLLNRWVESGARWADHWSFVAPRRPGLPLTKNQTWARNPIDHFVMAGLEKNGLQPNNDADKSALLRRASLDLTGLPPTVQQVDQFLADGSPEAYEKVVDQLLQSPQYGERMAQQWLDLARYADTSGYHFDGVRFMWLWRDWVIKAFNQNKRFDEFSIEQLAGDLLPHATPDQRVATGFVRNNMTNDEGGADPDEYLNKYVSDRVSTLGSVWLGLTVGCSECHDHKFDPIKNKEFYQLYAFFHNVPEKGLDRIRTDNPPPRLPVPTAEQARDFVEADFRLKDAEKTLQDKSNELGETQEKWERETSEQPPASPDLSKLRFLARFDTSIADQRGAEGNYQSSNRLEFVTGRVGKAVKFDGKSSIEFDSFAALDRTNAFSYGAWINLQAPNACVLSRMEPDPSYQGFDLLITDGRLEIHVVNNWPDNALKVKTKDQIPQNQWVHVLATSDGSGKAAGVKLYVNGKARETQVEQDKLTGSIVTEQPLRIGARPAGQFQFKGSIDDVRIYDRTLSLEEARLLVFDGYKPILAKSRGTRSGDERTDLARFYKENYAIDYLRADAALNKAKREKDGFYSKIPTTLIMEEMDPPRETFVLVRGDFRKKGERVYPATPAFLPPLPKGPTNRLTLAQWLMSKENPLAARVAVNRYWAMFFGTGLVRTANDFGAQGEWPSHPELLDWLAVQFRDGSAKGEFSGTPAATAWNVKALVRLLVTSSTYRQSAIATAEKLEKDPYNRLLSRAPHLRLDAEFIRDNALAISGLLDPKIGGPSVKPYQPPGLWDGVDAVFEQDHGNALYRRGMYVFWRRSSHYPSFATFDAPNREVCTFLRQRTQTPLQSLVLMNDPAYVECARGLAQRVLKEEPSDLEKRLARAFRHALARPPADQEMALLKKTYNEQLENFNADPKAAEELLKVGESKKPENCKPTELAALTAVANVILNLNETITR
jgi:hypothetical protein